MTSAPGVAAVEVADGRYRQIATAVWATVAGLPSTPRGGSRSRAGPGGSEACRTGRRRYRLLDRHLLDECCGDLRPTAP